MNSRSEIRRLAAQNPDALVQEIESLRAKLKLACTVLEVYANPDSWAMAQNSDFTTERSYEVCDFFGDGDKEPGTAARTALAELRKA